MWTTKKLKKEFHDFFEEKGHVTLPSSSVLPQNDPTLLFTNSGMVQFKNIFLGETPKYKRVNTNQHCIRAGGKHNDLDDVGKDNYHHTFFEMLGNWSFGDYFKKEAIEYAYEFLVETLKIDKERLYVTVFDEMDSESREIWKKYLPESRIITSRAKDNFWEMGEFGPCGPCTEIHYDRIGGRDASGLVNQDDPNVLEIWNIVFMEYERTPKGLIPMEEKKIDTGIGLERLLSILIDAKSNYLIDSFQEIIGFIESKCEFKYTDQENLIDMAFRVLADHARTLAICIHDEVGFSNEGVGYVLRRILRRAIRFADDILKIEDGVFSEIVECASNVMEIKIDISVINIEEEMFKKTLKRGLQKLNKIVESKNFIDSKDIFLLYDTYGFPKDLTKLIAEEKKVKFSMEDFDRIVEEAKEKSRTKKESPVTLNFSFEKTEDSFKYDFNDIKAVIQCIVCNNEIIKDFKQIDSFNDSFQQNDSFKHIDSFNDSIKDNQKVFCIFDKTCFYSEAGGQVGDTGIITFYENDKKVGTFEVIDCKNVRGYILHAGYLSGKVTSEAILHFDEKRRNLIKINHSACHILTYFLKKLIPDSEQQGSFVDDQKTTFDFNSEKLSDAFLENLEKKMNDFVKSSAKVEVLNMKSSDIDDSISHMKNVSYPENIRVIKMDNSEDCDKAMCCGTHVSNTSEIESIKIINESGVGVGLRRITLVSSGKAIECEKNAERLLKEIKNGKIAVIDCQVSVSDRKIIEEENKILIKNKAKKIKLETEELVKKLEEKILSEGISEINLNSDVKSDINSFIKFEVKLSVDVLKKELIKVVSTLGSILEKKDRIGCVYSFFEEEKEVIIAAFLKDPKKKLESLNFENNLRISKNLIQGIISKENLNKFLY